MKGHPGRSICSVPGCGKFVQDNGYCQGHYRRPRGGGLKYHKSGDRKDDSFGNLKYFSCDAEHQSARHRMAGHFGVVPGGIIYAAEA